MVSTPTRTQLQRGGGSGGPCKAAIRLCSLGFWVKCGSEEWVCSSLGTSRCVRRASLRRQKSAGQRVGGAEGGALRESILPWGLSDRPLWGRTAGHCGGAETRDWRMSIRRADRCPPQETALQFVYPAATGRQPTLCPRSLEPRRPRPWAGPGRAGRGRDDWLVPRLVPRWWRRRRRRRRRHGERGLRRGQGGRLLRPAALPNAAAGGGARCVHGESAGAGTQLRPRP